MREKSYYSVRKGVVEDSIKWSKVKEVNPRRKGDKICVLCNTEKTHIAVGNPDVLLNKRNEICRYVGTEITLFYQITCL